MDNFDSNSISLAALIVSAIAILASIWSAMRQEIISRAAVKLQRDTDLLKWGTDCVRILQELIEFTFRIEAEPIAELKSRRIDLLSEVSIQIDIGKWLLPNYKTGSEDKTIPAAYRGYRPVAIDALLYSYRTFKSFDLGNKESIDDLRQFLVHTKREFVSQIALKIDPERLMLATGEKPEYPNWLHPKELLPARYQNDDGTSEEA